MRILDGSIRQKIDNDTDDAGLGVPVTMYNQEPRFKERGSAVVTAETHGRIIQNRPSQSFTRVSTYIWMGS
jgi:hypothetical protein